MKWNFSFGISFSGYVNIIGTQREFILSFKPGVKSGWAFLQVHGEGDTLVLRSDPLSQSLELVGFFLRDAEVIMPAHKEHGLVDGQSRSAAIGQSPADRSIGFLGPTPQFDLVLPALATSINQ